MQDISMRATGDMRTTVTRVYEHNGVHYEIRWPNPPYQRSHLTYLNGVPNYNAATDKFRNI
jgi:hypothetical protein